MKKWLALLIVSGAPGFLAHAATIDFGQTSYSGPIGQNVALDLFISGLPVGVSVGAFDLTLHFDPTVLGYQSFTFGPYLGDPAAFEVLNSATQMGAANVEVASVSLLSGAELDALQGPNFKLGTLLLNAVAAGNSGVTITGDVSNALGQPVGILFQGATVTTGIPEPGAGLLVLMGLAGIALPPAVRRARSSRAGNSRELNQVGGS